MFLLTSCEVEVTCKGNQGKPVLKFNHDSPCAGETSPFLISRIRFPESQV